MADSSVTEQVLGVAIDSLLDILATRDARITQLEGLLDDATDEVVNMREVLESYGCSAVT